MAARGPLRRWKRFFFVFDTIDAAITVVGNGSGGDEVGCAEVLRQTKAEVIQLLCDAPEDDDAEYLCVILDDVMVEYLVTLKTVPVTPSALVSTGLATAVGALLEHESEKVRGLARDAVGRWKAAVGSYLAEARALVEKLRKISDSDETLVTKTSRPSVVGHAVGSCNHVPPVASADGKKKKKQVEDSSRTTKTAIRSSNLVEMGEQSSVPAMVSAPQLPIKSAPVVCANAVSSDKMTVPVKRVPAMVGNGVRDDRAGIDRMEATKRKLRAGYQEAEDAKRQRKIVVVEAPKMAKQQLKVVEQRQRQRPAKMPAPFLKKGAPVVGVGRASMATMDKMPATDKKMEATKRKLPRMAEDAKLLPKMVEQRQRKIHPVIGEGSQPGCGASTALRRSLMPSFCRV